MHRADFSRDSGALGPAPAPQAAILGVDPGLRCTGYALLSADASEQTPRLVEAGVIRLCADEALEQRLFELDRGLAEIIAAHRPAVMACENLYAHYKHPRTAILMGHARGVILAAAARAGLQVVGVSATNVKKLLTGHGRASKAQIQRAVAAVLGLPNVPEPHDVADAIAIAMTGLRLRAAAERVREAVS
jgi:crossover junction endodeoxyribonuclease RuvC